MSRSVALAVLLVSTVAAAEPTRTYVLAIGNNAVPQDAPRGLTPLRYADDDAARIYELAQSFAQRSALFSVLDSDSQARFPDAARAARPPTLWELRAVLHDLREQLLADRQAGRTTALLFFFSGHGVDGKDGASLALLDGPLTRRVLYDEILTLPASYIHLIVDACHAEAVVRPRDASATAVDVSASEAQRWVEQETLARFPNVGAIIATSPEQQTHEWDRYQAGVFSHEVISGLRGAADVNGDRQVEYSELHAFLSAANREVRDPRARPEVLVKAPPLALRVPIVDLREVHGLGWASFGGSSAPVYIETAAGERLADAFVELGHRVRIAVPTWVPLFYRTDAGEAQVSIADGKEVRLDALKLGPSQVRTRGALASALDDGVFAVPFGPAYYRGFVDSQGLATVTFTPATQVKPRSFVPSATLFAGAAGLGVAAIVAGALALSARSDFDSTMIQRTADNARHRYDAYRIAAYSTLGISLATAAVGLAVHPWYTEIEDPMTPTNLLCALFLLAAPLSGCGSSSGGVGQACNDDHDCASDLVCGGEGACEQGTTTRGCSCTCTGTSCSCTGNGCGDQGSTSSPDGGSSSGGKRVFITSTGYHGDFGGIAAGDGLCASAAQAAGLGGTWVAWLSDSTTQAYERVKDASPWYLTNGTKAFGSAAQLRTQPTVIIDRDENGTQVDVQATIVWTGTNSGGLASGSNCSEWTDYSFEGTTGFLDSTNDWTSTRDDSCTDANRLYCFEQ